MKPKAVWTPAEDTLVRRHYKTAITNVELEALFDGKTISQIASRAHHMGIRRGRRVGTGNSNVEKVDAAPFTFDRDEDARHVEACLAEGGFPNVQIIDGRATWQWPKLKFIGIELAA